MCGSIRLPTCWRRVPVPTAITSPSSQAPSRPRPATRQMAATSCNAFSESGSRVRRLRQPTARPRSFFRPSGRKQRAPLPPFNRRRRWLSPRRRRVFWAKCWEFSKEMTVRTAPKTTLNKIQSRLHEGIISGADAAFHQKIFTIKPNRQNYLWPAVSNEVKLLNSSGERLPTGRIALDQWAFLISPARFPAVSSSARGRRCRWQ